MNWSDIEDYDLLAIEQIQFDDIPEGFTIREIRTARGTYYQPLREWKPGQTEALYKDDHLDPVVYKTQQGARRCCKAFAQDPVARDELVWSRRNRQELTLIHVNF